MNKLDKPLVWPTLIYDLDKNKEIVHINMNANPTTITEWLDEIDFEFPHIAKKLALLVGHKEFEMAMLDLIVDNRGNRNGFPEHIFRCLLKLSILHTEIYGNLLAETGIWYFDQHRNKEKNK